MEAAVGFTPIARVRDVQDPTLWPARAVAKLFRLDAAGVRTHNACTAQFVGPRYLVTAAHCVIDRTTGQPFAGWGRVVNITSLTVLRAVERTAYAAAKAALVSFTRSWALELAKTGITVNAVSPGPTETALFRANNAPGSEGERRYLEGVPMGRFGQPDEIAAAIAFLLSKDPGFVTGQTIHVDGGASIGRAAF